MDYLAIDIGGAALKAADGRGYVSSDRFALWQHPEKLAQELRTVIAGGPPCDHLLVTMTGELADCFASKNLGVQHILNAVDEAADGRHTRIYRTDGKMVTPQVARRSPELVGAANWHALARFAGRNAKEGVGLMVDVGSTTVDIVPLNNGEVAALGKTDTERLLSRELVYTGVERSPVCAIATAVPYRGQSCPVAQELFATTQDVYLVLKKLADDPTNSFTADGKPATKGAARIRLGRSICADEGEFNHRDAVAMAQALAEAQLLRISSAINEVAQRQPSPPRMIVLSGHGEFLGAQAIAKLKLKAEVMSLTQSLGPAVSRCATAHALAVLAREAAGV
jgi:probable H4MPT-linked C1 transfer pathway protein